MVKKVNLGVIVGTRNIFSSKLAVEGRKSLLKQLDFLQLGYEILPEKDTPNGAVETYQDAQKYADFFRSKISQIDGIIISLPNFGDEIGIIETLKMSALNVPVLVQASNDSIDKVDIHTRRDAFCGKLSVCNNLYQYGIPFTDTTSHTCDIDSDVFRKDLEQFASICRIVKGLKNLRIGAIGTRPAAFRTVRFSEKLLQQTGITVIPVDLSEIFAKTEKIDNNSSDLKSKLESIHAYGKVPDHIKNENVIKQAKFSIVVEDWMKENDLQASAIQCWDSIQYNYGCASCLTMSMMGENMIPSACEMDIAGAVSMYTLLQASGNPPGFLDWNNNFGTEANKCVCTHCSNYPKSFMGSDIEISNLDILGGTIGFDRCFGAIKGNVAPGDMTYFRISTDDTNGKIKSYLGEGRFTDDSFGMDGGIAVCELPNMRELFAYLCQNGFEHHVAMTRGNVAFAVKEAVSKYLKWDLYHHI